MGTRLVEACEPAVSVAVSTYQRSHLLPRLVAALEAQTLPHDRFEVVIADDGSTDETAAVLRQLEAATPLRLRTLRVGVNRGPSIGRNLAWRAARGPIIAFTDDDTIPTPGWLAAGVAALGDADIAVGQTTFPPEDEVLAGRPFTRVLEVHDARYFQTCNVFYRRPYLEAVGGFDEGLESPSAEDTELALRICQRGARVAFAEDALVHHPVRPPSYRRTVTETLRWTGIPAVVARHPACRQTLLHRRYFWKPSHPVALLALAGLLIGMKTPLGFLLAVPWVHHRLLVSPPCAGARRRLLVLPAVLPIDRLEVLTMVRGSVRHRVLVL